MTARPAPQADTIDGESVTDPESGENGAMAQSAPEPPQFVIQYSFNFEDGHEWEHMLCLDPHTLSSRPANPAALSDWTRLGFHQCPHCPLHSEESAHCPVAANLETLVQEVGNLPSYSEVFVSVATPDRKISSDTTLQRAVGSLLGLVFATSDCPYTQYMRPMARYHLPFASEEETIYRATSMYLLAQYFKSEQGEEIDLTFAGLSEIYANLHILNGAMASRLRAACEQDATVNAIVLLDLLAKALPQSIEDHLLELNHLFASYLETGEEAET